jgi:hypothetical protein
VYESVQDVVTSTHRSPAPFLQGDGKQDVYCLVCDSSSKERQHRSSKQKGRNFMDHDILCPLGF